MSQSESFPLGGTSPNPGPPASTGKPGKKSKKKSAKTIAGPRRVRLSLTRIDPWSVMKVSFMLSVAGGIMFVMAAVFVWLTLDGMHVFSTIEDLVSTIDSETNAFKALVEYLALKRTASMAIIIAVVNVVLTTALSTVMAFLYNLTARLVGGVHLTLADE